jgi:hypothetical protein
VDCGVHIVLRSLSIHCKSLDTKFFSHSLVQLLEEQFPSIVFGTTLSMSLVCVSIVNRCNRSHLLIRFSAYFSSFLFVLFRGIQHTCRLRRRILLKESWVGKSSVSHSVARVIGGTKRAPIGHMKPYRRSL